VTCAAWHVSGEYAFEGHLSKPLTVKVHAFDGEAHLTAK
jgi:hypothetical protein